MDPSRGAQDEKHPCWLVDLKSGWNVPNFFITDPGIDPGTQSSTEFDRSRTCSGIIVLDLIRDLLRIL